MTYSTMGQCYNVRLKIKTSDEQGAIRALQNKISQGPQENINYNTETFEGEGTHTDTLDDLIRIFLAGYKESPWCSFHIEKKGGFTYYESEFTACYGWETVMLDFFDLLAPYLADLSWIKIWPDSGLDYGIVRNHTVTWKS